MINYQATELVSSASVNLRSKFTWCVTWKFSDLKLSFFRICLFPELVGRCYRPAVSKIWAKCWENCSNGFLFWLNLLVTAGNCMKDPRRMHLYDFWSILRQKIFCRTLLMHLAQTHKLEILFLLLITTVRNVNMDLIKHFSLYLFCVISMISMAAQSEMRFILWYCTRIYFIGNNF